MQVNPVIEPPVQGFSFCVRLIRTNIAGTKFPLCGSELINFGQIETKLVKKCPMVGRFKIFLLYREGDVCKIGLPVGGTGGEPAFAFFVHSGLNTKD